jgi:hypothetical protein
MHSRLSGIGKDRIQMKRRIFWKSCPKRRSLNSQRIPAQPILFVTWHLPKLLRGWSRYGEKGRLFDGVSNIRIDGRVAHFELGQIPEHASEMRAAANFLVANYGRQKIVAMPRAVPKIAIFEGAARTLEIPGGVRMIQEYYRQMRKIWLQHSGGFSKHRRSAEP